jgi:hypothetical protein
MNANLANILASVEVARIELEYASADLAEKGWVDRWCVDPGHLETMLAKLQVARAALAAAQETLGDTSTRAPAREMAAAAS